MQYGGAYTLLRVPLRVAVNVNAYLFTPIKYNTYGTLMAPDGVKKASRFEFALRGAI